MKNADATKSPKPKKCHGPWVLLATDRRALGREIRVVSRASDGRPSTTEIPRLFRRFDSEQDAKAWLKVNVKSRRYLFTPSEVPAR